MNPHLKVIQDLLKQNKQLTSPERETLLKAIADADKQWSITDFKLDRTEKVKRTTAILLEETIAELEQKRKAVEAQNHELEIESSLERVRSVAMGMKKREDMLEICKIISSQLDQLNVKEIRNVQTAIFYESKGVYTNYEYYAKHDKLLITEVDYKNHPVSKQFADQMKGGPGEVWIHGFKDDEVKEWLNYQKTTNVFIDTFLETANSLTYYWHSLGPVALGISTYLPLTEREVDLFKRFKNVFELAYRRYVDIEQAEAHALQAEQDLIEIKMAKQKAEETLTELQTTQKQLIQSEKMASLGELTAGIAHEIQNPLNFVNNFSDVSNELIDEMMEEVKKGNFEEAKTLAEDIRKNLEKISHHGKRADGIVKGMLQHSRMSSGQKELTDLNALADEYLRLAYHGLRAKDKSFNAKFETDFDNSIGKIKIVPQEIGRVLLNLINNAFYAVTEKKSQQPDSYEPNVTVRSKKNIGKIEISVTDNGNGISKAIIDKIFQPFFTTKPTGQGTGLGLSLAYDIITKGHGGELKVETKENEGSVFTIQLPLNQK